MASPAHDKRPVDGTGTISIILSSAALIAFGAFTLMFFEGFLPEVMNYPGLHN